jgi:spermidine synthase
VRPWAVIERVESPDGALELRRRGSDDFLIALDGRVLMNSRAQRSEIALAELACRRLARAGAPRVLIGGLGMGITLRAALDALPPSAQVVVAELHPPVAAWCRSPLAGVNRGALADPRVRLVLEDVAATIRRAGDEGPPCDAILLDLYEGPPAGPAARRDPHFGDAALAAVRAALARGGVLGVWSEGPVPSFEAALARAGFEVARHRPGRGGLRHVVYIATCAA